MAGAAEKEAEMCIFCRQTRPQRPTAAIILAFVRRIFKTTSDDERTTGRFGRR